MRDGKASATSGLKMSLSSRQSSIPMSLYVCVCVSVCVCFCNYMFVFLRVCVHVTS